MSGFSGGIMTTDASRASGRSLCRDRGPRSRQNDFRGDEREERRVGSLAASAESDPLISEFIEIRQFQEELGHGKFPSW